MFYYPFKDLKVAEQFVEGLIKAGWPGEKYEYYKISEENRLAGEQIKSLVFGRKIAGSEGLIERSNDGIAYCRQCFKSIEANSWMAPTFRDTGKSWIEDCRVCGAADSRIRGLIAHRYAGFGSRPAFPGIAGTWRWRYGRRWVAKPRSGYLLSLELNRSAPRTEG